MSSTQRRARSPRYFHALTKPTGAICNLDCSYCFFLEKEALYPGDTFRMSEEVLTRFVGQLFEASPEGEVNVAFQGGEPTIMGAEFFRRAVEIAYDSAGENQRPIFTIQTNGTLLTDEICEVFAANDFLVGISIDGPPELHDANRLTKRGEATYAKVVDGLELLKRHRIEFNILCTVNAANEAHPLTVYRHLRDELGARHIQFIPVVEWTSPGTDPAEYSVSPSGWGNFMCRIFDEWFPNDVGHVFMNHFESALAGWVGLPPSLCIFGETCGNAIVVEHNGDVYACDHFVDPEHLVGNITKTPLDEILDAPALAEFGENKRDLLPPQCLACDYLHLCHGECPKNRFDIGDRVGLNYLCDGYYAFFDHTARPMRLISELVRSGRPARGVVELLASAPRNSPCPCGSGRKAKACHQSPARRS